MKTIRVEIPMLPPPQLNPNWRGHWSARAKAARSFRGAAMVCALGASDFSHPDFPRAQLSVGIVIPDRRYMRDTDNALASLKPAVDGCVDAGIIRDDAPGNLTYAMPVEYEVDKDRAPLTVLVFTEVK